MKIGMKTMTFPEINIQARKPLNFCHFSDHGTVTEVGSSSNDC